MLRIAGRIQRRSLWAFLFSAALCGMVGCATSGTADAGQAAREQAAPPPVAAASTDSLGNFSVSLSVKDLPASLAFYQKLGFRPIAGDSVRYVILQTDTATIGLFQGFFQGNVLTFNPGWDRSSATLAQFQDVREIQRRLIAQGITPTLVADENSTGPASLMVLDPDGNQILFDQHVASPVN